MKIFLEKLVYKIICNFPVEDLKKIDLEIRKLLSSKNALHRFAPFLKWQNPPAHWEELRQPWRPSTGDLRNYEDAISAFPPNSKILILGATPELRDLAVSRNFKPAVVDFSLPMLIEMLRYTKKANADNEIWIKSDWLEAPLEGNFDIVLGDLVLRLIEAGQEERFLKKIKSILSPKGIFITRVHFIDESLSELTYEEILNKSIDFSDEKAAASILTGRIFDRFSVPKDKIFYHEKAVEFVKRAADIAKNPEEKKILSKVLKFVSGGMGWPITEKEIRWSINSEVQLENLLSRFFDIIDIKIADDCPDANFYPIYFLKK